MAPVEKVAELTLASDAQVLEQLASLVRSGRRVTAEIVAHLAEIDERRLHLKAGYNSLFAYCVSVHRMSEDEACRRIEVARLGRRSPAILPMLAGGQLSLSVAALLKAYLTEENQAQLLAAVSGRSVSAARELLAARFPMPDVPASVRKLPERSSPLRQHATSKPHQTILAPTQPQTSSGPHASRAILAPTQPQTSSGPHASRAILAPTQPQTSSGPHASRAIRDVADCQEANVSAREGELPDGVARFSEVVGELAARPAPELAVPSATDVGPQMLAREQPASDSIRPGDRGRIEPTSLGRYRVQFTASAAFKEKLELLRDLMSHRNPTRDFAPIVEQALDLLLEKLLRERAGKAARSRPEAERNAMPRRVTRATQRAVSMRDGLRCSFVGAHGQRCEGRAFLEYDHVRPFAKGGHSGPDNLRLLCRSHNRLLAEMEYGSAKVSSEIEKRRERARQPESQTSSPGSD